MGILFAAWKVNFLFRVKFHSTERISENRCDCQATRWKTSLKREKLPI